MADSRINLLTSALTTANDDFFVVDGSTNGTRKLNAFSPTIGGNLAVTGTLTVSGTGTNSIPNLSVTGIGGLNVSANFLTSANTFRFSDSAAGGQTWFMSPQLGDGVATNFAFYSNDGVTSTPLFRVSSAGVFRLPSTAASTNTSSGALIVGNGSSGGLGVGGDTFIGGSLTVTGTSNGIICNGAGLSLNTSGSASVRFQDAGVSKWWIYKLSGDINLYYRDMLNGRMQAVMVPGASNTTASTDFYSNVVCKGTLYVSSTTAQVIIGEASASQLTYLIRGAQAGGAIQIVQDSATVNRWLALGGCDNNGVFGEGLRVGPNISIPGTTASTSTSSGALVVSGGVGVAGNTNIGGVASVGGSSNAAVGIYVINTALTGVDQYGVASEPIWTSAATAGHTIWARTKTAASAFTLNHGQAFFVEQPTLGAGSSITNIYGMRIRNQGTTGVTNAYGLYVESQSGAATVNYAIYTAGGRINFQGLPTSSAGLPAGTLWNDAGTLKVA